MVKKKNTSRTKIIQGIFCVVFFLAILFSFYVNHNGFSFSRFGQEAAIVSGGNPQKDGPVLKCLAAVKTDTDAFAGRVRGERNNPRICSGEINDFNKIFAQAVYKIDQFDANPKLSQSSKNYYIAGQIKNIEDQEEKIAKCLNLYTGEPHFNPGHCDYPPLPVSDPSGDGSDSNNSNSGSNGNTAGNQGENGGGGTGGNTTGQNGNNGGVFQGVGNGGTVVVPLFTINVQSALDKKVTTNIRRSDGMFITWAPIHTFFLSNNISTIELVPADTGSIIPAIVLRSNVADDGKSSKITFANSVQPGVYVIRITGKDRQNKLNTRSFSSQPFVLYTDDSDKNALLVLWEKIVGLFR